MIIDAADTHAALWHLFDDPRLSRAAGEFINDAATNLYKIAVSSISLAEVVYLIEKNRLLASMYDHLSNALADPEHILTEAAYTAVIEAMRQVPRPSSGSAGPYYCDNSGVFQCSSH